MDDLKMQTLEQAEGDIFRAAETYAHACKWFGPTDQADSQAEMQSIVRAYMLELISLRARVAVLERDKVRLDALSLHVNWKLSNEDYDCDLRWEVHRVTGYPNDREWHKIGSGNTAREAIDAAIAAQPQKEMK